MIGLVRHIVPFPFPLSLFFTICCVVWWSEYKNDTTHCCLLVTQISITSRSWKPDSMLHWGLWEIRFLSTASWFWWMHGKDERPRTTSENSSMHMSGSLKTNQLFTVFTVFYCSIVYYNREETHWATKLKLQCFMGFPPTPTVCLLLHLLLFVRICDLEQDKVLTNDEWMKTGTRRHVNTYDFSFICALNMCLFPYTKTFFFSLLRFTPLVKSINIWSISIALTFLASNSSCTILRIALI